MARSPDDRPSATVADELLPFSTRNLGGFGGRVNRPEGGDGPPEVGPRAGLQALDEPRRRIDGRAGHEALEDLRPAPAELALGHEGVLAPDVALVLVEPGRIAAEDRQIDVTDERGVILRITSPAMPGGEDQPADLRQVLGADAGPPQELLGQRGAPLFVVARIGIVDDVVEPERRFDLVGPAGSRRDLIEEGQAFVEMAKVVVGPASGAVVAEYDRERCIGIAAGAEPAPELPPPLGPGAGRQKPNPARA